MKPTAITSGETWNATLAALPLAHFLQAWEWGQFKGRHGWTPRYMLWKDEAGQPRAAALVLRRQVGRLPVRVMYVPKGPALDYGDAALVNQVLADLEKFARQSRAIFVKIDPDLGPHPQPFSLIGRRGWRASAEQIQFRNTLEIDLRYSEDELLTAMHHKTRYNIRLAEKRGVTVRTGTGADLDLLYAMYDETARRDHFIIRPPEYYRDEWGSLIQAGLAQPLIAQVEQAPVAGLVLVRFAQRATYFIGMSRDVHRNLMPTYLLQWEAMRWARAQGCTVYDMWGAPDKLDESDPLWGIYRFKKGFGAQFVEHGGAYDYATSPPFYWLYTAAMPRLLGLMRRRHWAHGKQPRAGQDT